MLTRIISKRTFAVASGAAAASAVGGYYYLNSGPSYPPSTTQSRRPPPPWTPPSRQVMLENLRSSTKNGEEFDLLIIGGGATGAGVAVDAATRGLKVAVVERDDFSAGASYLSIGCNLSLPATTQELPQSPRSLFMVVFGICRRQSWSSTTSSTSL